MSEDSKVWEIHKCPRCKGKWGIEVEKASGRPILDMCPRCVNEIRCAHQTEHPMDCFCNFDRKPDEPA